jgi:pimeloyl-ACP methyl ester carboxylesterase
MSEGDVAQIDLPVLIAVGTKDDVAGDPHKLAALFRAARAADIPGRDHNRAVGDKVYKDSVLEFLEQRP